MSEIDWPWLHNYIWPRSFKIWMTGPKICWAPNKMELFFNICFIFFAESHIWGCRCHQNPILATLTPRLGSSPCQGRWNLTELTIGKVDYNFCFTNSAWKWLTTAPEVHVAQVLQDPDFGSKDVFCPLINHVCYITFVLQSFCQVSCLRLQSHPDSICPTLALGLGSGLKLRDYDLTKSTIEKVNYNFCFENSAWK